MATVSPALTRFAVGDADRKAHIGIEHAESGFSELQSSDNAGLAGGDYGFGACLGARRSRWW